MARFSKEADDYVMLVDLQEKYKNTPKVVDDIVASAPSRRLHGLAPARANAQRKRSAAGVRAGAHAR